MRTIPNVCHLLKRPIKNKFIPAVTKSYICNDKERLLVSLSTRYGELEIAIYKFVAPARSQKNKTTIKQQALQCDHTKIV